MRFLLVRLVAAHPERSRGEHSLPILPLGYFVTRARPGANRITILREPALAMLMAVGGEQTSLGSAALMTLQRRMEQVVEKEVTRISAKRQRYREQGKPAPT